MKEAAVKRWRFLLMKGVLFMRWDLRKGLPESFLYAASGKVAYRAEFQREETGIVNARMTLPDGKETYQYISAVNATPVALPAVLTIETSFDAYGAPLIVLAEEIRALSDGRREYGTHYEAVLYEGGINLWKLEPKPEGGCLVTSLCRAKGSIPAGNRLTLNVRATRAGIRAWSDSVTAEAACPLPETLYCGLTACEGINHFCAYAVEENLT